MLAIHSLVCYRQNGVCEIVGTETKTLAGQTQEYYVLKPLRSQGATGVVPIGNPQLEAAMRPLVTREEIFCLVSNNPDCHAVEEQNPRTRKELFTAILNSGDHAELLALVQSIRRQRDTLQLEGKKLRGADDTAMKRAEALLNDEFSAVLGIPPAKVEAYIRETVHA